MSVNKIFVYFCIKAFVCMYVCMYEQIFSKEQKVLFSTGPVLTSKQLFCIVFKTKTRKDLFRIYLTDNKKIPLVEVLLQSPPFVV